MPENRTARVAVSEKHRDDTQCASRAETSNTM